ncbi:LysR substrate-binding domain-containing protein [Virgibacillus kekensis]|uniref:LysR substrate-binding domain-containing protein n=1 Tax=Virgibacillus kekensis TaxID=202261 RepID=A0ABV9DHS6_9BACI
MNLGQLEAFVYISLTGSFSKAGELMYASQPSISSKVKALERELDVSLFERVNNNVFLTEEGKVFLPYAQDIIKNMQDGRMAIKKCNTEVLEGEVHISVVFSGTEYFLPKLVHDFNKKHPNIKLVIHSGHSDQVMNMVLENEVSLGIVRSISHPKIESIQLEEDEIILVYHPDSLKGYEKIEMTELVKHPLILFKRETIDWILINNAVKKTNLEPNIIMEIDSIEGVKQMVKKNVGFSFLPRFSVERELNTGELKTMDVKGIPSIHRNFELIYKKGFELDKITAVFKDFLLGSLEER